MARLKLRIEHTIDFCVAAKVEAFGFEAMVAFRRKKIAGQGALKLTKEDTVELALDEFSDMISDQPPTLEQ